MANLRFPRAEMYNVNISCRDLTSKSPQCLGKIVDRTWHQLVLPVKENLECLQCGRGGWGAGRRGADVESRPSTSIPRIVHLAHSGVVPKF